MRVLVAGLPRSGTTWVGEALARVPGTAYVHEPDNRDVDRFAGVAKRGLGRFGFHPVVEAGQRADTYAVLWDLAFRGGWPDRRALGRLRRLAEQSPPRLHVAGLTALARGAARVPQRADHVVVKSVHSTLALEWVAGHTGATVVVVRRPVPEVVASWLERDFVGYPLDEVPAVRRRWLDALGLPPRPAGDRVADVAWTVAVLDLILARTTASHPDWVLADHPSLCEAPVERFRELFARAGMPWDAAVERFLVESDRPGTGFATQRVASQERDKWLRRLSPEDVATVRRVGAEVAEGAAATAVAPAQPESGAAPTIAARDAARPAARG
jgi:hypothetical protein